MPEPNGHYLSRFDRVDKNPEILSKQMNELGRAQNKHQEQLNTLTAEVQTMHETLKGLNENTDRLLSGLRELIDRIPPENLR